MIELSREQQIKLLALARRTIGERLGSFSGDDMIIMDDPVFDEKCGAFVTLHIKGNLRGCIGYITGVKSMKETIGEMSVSSAFGDPRFHPLTPEEYSLIDIEISILSPVEKVEDINEIVVGRDGLIISKGNRRGLLLPQVPVEQGWGKEEFLEHTCYKAGLPADSWKSEGVIIEKFSASVFSEKNLGIV